VDLSTPLGDVCGAFVYLFGLARCQSFRRAVGPSQRRDVGRLDVRFGWQLAVGTSVPCVYRSRTQRRCRRLRRSNQPTGQPPTHPVPLRPPPSAATGVLIRFYGGSDLEHNRNRKEKQKQQHRRSAAPLVVSFPFCFTLVLYAIRFVLAPLESQSQSLLCRRRCRWLTYWL